MRFIGILLLVCVSSPSLLCQAFHLPSPTAIDGGRHQKDETKSAMLFLSCSEESSTTNDDHQHHHQHVEELFHYDDDDDDGEFSSPVSTSFSMMNRRASIASAAALGSSLLLPRQSQGAEQQQQQQEENDIMPNLMCLADLPPLADDAVRIFLCRHGQTENNRLKLVQGARVDPPLNDNGRLQAKRLGLALSNAQQQQQSPPPPTMGPPYTILHSPLLRARQTAAVAAEAYNPGADKAVKKVQLGMLASLAEVDFGGVAEGGPIEDVRQQMVATYGAWSAGNIDVSMAGGGETGRQVLKRIESALQSLVQIASIEEGRTIAAVAHSTYLRMLLAVVQDRPLLVASTLMQKNCCVNVLDLQMDIGATYAATTVLGPRSALVGGKLSRAPSDFGLQVPKCKVWRINEHRHLGNLA